MSTLPEIKLLQIFQLVSKLGSISKAANRLGVTQSTVTHQIQRLENQLGVALFERETRPLQLTHAGRFLEKRSQLHIKQLEETIYYLAHQEKLAMQEIRLGMSRFIADLFLGSIINSLEPIVASIYTSTGNVEELNNYFLEKKLDCVISSRELDIEEKIIERKICSQGVFGIYSGTLSQKNKSKIDLNYLLENVLFIDFPISTQIGRLIKQLLFILQKEPKRTISVDTAPSAFQILRTTPSWSMSLPLATTNYTEDIYAGVIQYFDLPDPKLYADVYLSASANMPSAVFEKIANAMKTQLNTSIIKEQFKKLPELQKMVKVYS